MAFQRSYSKVWWGSDNRLPGPSAAGFGAGSYLGHSQQPSAYHSLELGGNRGFGGNLSRIQEIDDEQNISSLSAAWLKHDSPGSLRSQDSGFSDNEESHSTRSLGGGSSIGSKTLASPSNLSLRSTKSAESPLGAESAPTPPTVIRRVSKSEFISPLMSVSRRISFTSSSPASQNASEEDGAMQMLPPEELGLLNSTPEDQKCAAETSGNGTAAIREKRHRRVTRRATKPLVRSKRVALVQQQTSDDDDAENGLESAIDVGNQLTSVPAYNNETVYLGAGTPSAQNYHNETIILGGADASTDASPNSSELFSLLRDTSGYTKNTSTPKRQQQQDNSRVNSHTAALQCWLDDLRQSYHQEVMSTLQAKSIAQEAFKNLTITTSTVTKLIRQLQQRAIRLQSDFERIERSLAAGGGGGNSATLQQALDSCTGLLENVAEFEQVLRRRVIFFADSHAERRRYDGNIEQISIIAKDMRYSLERHHYISRESLLDDLEVMKRHVLIAIRHVFDRMVLVIIQAIDTSRCDLMLRANINMICTLSNIDYEGFASLTNAFVQCAAVRSLLILCLEHRVSSVRALALRALATICCSPEAIAQLSAYSGVEILRDTLQGPQAEGGETQRKQRTETERREAVSVLTQITAAWHGPKHQIDGLHDNVEGIVEGVTNLVAATTCSQTLLLCTATLNNLSRMEMTSHYSIMSHESIFRLIDMPQQIEFDEVSIFFYEQVASMLHNMSLNKKCHSHLANGSIINFITSTYQTEFYKSYESRAEAEAQRRTIKAILHTLTRLMYESHLGVDLLDQQYNVPTFLRGTASPNSAAADLSQLHAEISLLARDLLSAQRTEQPSQLNESDAASEWSVHCQLLVASGNAAADTARSASALKLNLTPQESYV